MRGAGRPAALGGFGDARGDVVPDCALVGHPEDRAAGVLAGDAQHRRSECREQDRHRDGVGDVHRTVHGKAVVLDVNRTRPGDGRVENFEVTAHQTGRPIVGQPELVADDPVMGWPDAERESASARHLRGQRLLCHRNGMPGLDGHDGGSEFDAVGRLSQECDRCHGVEIAGDLRDPEGREAILLSALAVGDQAGQSVGARALLIRADHQADAHGILLSRNIAVPFVRDDRVERCRNERLDTR